MPQKILIGLGVAAGLFVVVGLLLPATAHVERTALIRAPAATVFTVVNGFRQFDKWSPWVDVDPDATTTLEGPDAGVGAKMSWAGNADVGTGSQEIIESVPYRFVKQRLSFGDFAGDFRSSFSLAPEDSGTRVVWAFDADYGSSLLGRYFGIVSDGMLGPDYEKGLARLAVLVESLPADDFSSLSFERVETSADPLVVTPVRSADDPTAIGVALGVAYGRLSGYMNTERLTQTAPPLAIFRGTEGGVLAIDAAIPVDRADARPVGAVGSGRLPAGRAVRAEYRGPYTGLAAARAQVAAYLAAAGLEAAGPPWEQYVSDPARTPESQLVTHIFAPVK